jgi:hypothetical protein
LFDSFFWGWSLPPAASVSEKSDASSADSAVASAALADSVGWTSRLEFSLVELLVSVDEVLLPMLESMRRMVPQEVCLLCMNRNRALENSCSCLVVPIYRRVHLSLRTINSS